MDATTATSTARSWALAHRIAARVEPPALAAWTLAFTLVAYLALRDGGYGTVVRSEVAVAIWWIVLLVAAAGLLPFRLGVASIVAIALLSGFAAWTGLAVGWSESAERSVTELGRVAAYLGVLVLGIAVQGRAAARHTVNGLACAIGVISLLAVLSRLHPQSFPGNDHFEFLGLGSARKLSYPLNYWNALAGFAAMGFPLLIAVALGARTLAGQALAAAALPITALCVYMTISRGGTLAAAAGLLAFLILVPRRVDALATLVVGAAGTALLVIATAQRDVLATGLPSPAASAEGDELLWLLVIVCLGVGLAQVAIGLCMRHVERPRLLAPSRRTLALRTLAVGAAVAVLAVVAGAPGAVSSTWRDFKAPAGLVAPGSESSVFSRLQAANGNSRYQFWEAAVDAAATDPWKGIGPGTYELWWSRNATAPGFIRDAHMLYLETLAETGIVGLILLGGLLAWLAVVAVARSLRASPELRLWIAAATGALAAFLTTAALEWVWEMAAIAVTVMLLAGVILAGRDDAPVREPGDAPREPGSRPTRLAVVLLSIVALGAVLVPLAGAHATRESREAAADGRLTEALDHSETAERLQPYAATPQLQRALVLEAAGSLDAAAAAARAATADEPTNWRTWLVLARIDARRGAIDEAMDELRRARTLNPLSNLFAR